MTDIEKVKELMKKLKGELRQVINDNTNVASTLATKSGDPHTPILSMMQMAYANAAVDYMVLCGVPPVEALQLVTNVTGQAMQHWLETVLRLHGLSAKANQTSTVIENDTPRAN